METKTLVIKNMVCDRCITTAEAILTGLDIPFTTISLGEVNLERHLSPKETEALATKLKEVGFELLAGRNESLVNHIKTIVIQEVYEKDNLQNKNLSVILAEKLHYDYSYLSSLFSKAEGKSIQNFQNSIKTERAKELLEYDELSIQEIADKLGYGSAAYLSTSFKKATGITPSKYRLEHIRNRKTLDSV